uniref:Uncharacterized protein n=1 Tax=Cyprinus carpio carpio TaxID=630221 RepID=A0A8C1HRD5_CYPCA
MELDVTPVILHDLQLLLPAVELLLLAHQVENVRQVQERRRGHEDDLKHPQAHMRDGERFVIADILTTGLLSIALKVGSLVTPYVLRRCSQHQDPEDEEDAHPYLANDGGVGLYFVQTSLEDKQEIYTEFSTISFNKKPW